MDVATTRGIVRGLAPALVALLSACGGGAGGGSDTEVLTVDFRYADVQVDVRAPLSVVPVLTGLQGHKPTCTATAGTLPPGISLDASSCVLSGTPTVARPYGISVTLTAEGVTGALSAVMNLNVVDPTPAIVRANPTLPADATLAYGQAVAPIALTNIAPGYVAKPGDAITYVVQGGTLPSGITLDPTNGTVQGTPTGFGRSLFALAATLTRSGVEYPIAPIVLTVDVSALSVSVSYPVCLVGVGTVVNCVPQLGNPAAFVGLTLAYSATGLPAGVTIDPATGVISGQLVTVGSVAVSVSLRATYPNGAFIDVPAGASIGAAAVIPFYDPSPGNVGVLTGPRLDGLGDQMADVRAGQAFSIEVTGYNLSVPGDVHAFALLPWDASQPVPSWVSIDASTGRVFGIAPVGPVVGTWRVQLVTTRGGTGYPFERRWVVSLVP